MIVRGKGSGLSKMSEADQKYKIPVIRQISAGNMRYSMVTITNYTILIFENC